MRAVGVSAAGAVPRQEYSIGDGWRGLPAHLLEDVLQAVMQSSEKLPLQVLSQDSVGAYAWPASPSPLGSG